MLLDHCMDRIRPDWHGDGRGSFGARADGGKGSGADGACDGTNSEEPPPRRIYGRVYGWMLCTRSAWIMGFDIPVVRVRAEGKLTSAPPAARLCCEPKYRPTPPAAIRIETS